MSDVAKAQRSFADALVVPRASDARLDLLAGADALTRSRFRLYRGNLQANAAKALGNAYPVVAKLVGEQFFAGLALEYQLATPSTSGDLNEYGEGLATFLDNFAPAADLPYLGDVARLEWAVHCAHYAADAAPLDLARLASLPSERWGALRFALHAACAVLKSRWPVATIWAVHQPDHDGELDVDIDRAEYALVSRPKWRARADAIDAGAHAFLAGCAEGHDLSTCVASALALDPAFALQAPLARWISDSVIVDFRIEA
jgi:hypothetical protein